ncbi:MAG: CAP domain-containing protein [Gemmatimonadota bacterium]|nr:CAP domain-containing protein [Gemmatimonadota bacterium]
MSLLGIARERERLPQLRVDLRLMRAAQAHAEDLAAGGRSGHEGSDGSLPADRADLVSYPWVFVAENTSAGQATAAVAFAAWMDSAPHRANNLLVDAEHVGVGYAENPDTQYRSYWVVVFGRSYEAPFTPPGGCHP